MLGLRNWDFLQTEIECSQCQVIRIVTGNPNLKIFQNISEELRWIHFNSFYIKINTSFVVM